jgi:hypothetical protein
VLCDGSSFEFFSFDSTSGDTKFLHDIPQVYDLPRIKLTLPEYDTGVQYIIALRHLCEILFSLFLNGYAQALEAYQQKSVKPAAKERKPHGSKSKWTSALNSAREAIETANAAEKYAAKDRTNRSNTLLEADNQAAAALKLLEERFILFSEVYPVY